MNANMLMRMREVTKNPGFIEEMKDIFFAAMNTGYTANEKQRKSSLAGIPGYKVITFVSGYWKVIDAYQVSPLGDKSGGTTHILYDGTPTWMMHYFGQYPEEAIPCLKAALRETYVKKRFVGGRGPDCFIHENYMYRNQSPFGNFRYFSGREHIEDRKYVKDLYGWHVYHGGLML